MIPPHTVGVNNKSAIFVVQSDASVNVCPESTMACSVSAGSSSQKRTAGQGQGLGKGSVVGQKVGQGQGSGFEMVVSEAHILHFITEVSNRK